MGPAGAGVESVEPGSGSDARRDAAAPVPREPVGLAGVTGGTVRWVDASRAHGAIATERTAPWDIWFHFSCIDGQRPALVPGDRVEVRFLRLDLDSFRYVAHLVKVIEPAA